MPTTQRFALALACVALGLAGACSSSKPMTPARDAAPEAFADLGSDPQPKTDVGDTATTPDEPATVTRDVPVDPAVDKDAIPADRAADVFVPADVADVLAAETDRDMGARDAVDAPADLGTAEAAQDVADGPLDASGDLATACTPGRDQTCNDSPASALWGTCNSD